MVQSNAVISGVISVFLVSATSLAVAQDAAEILPAETLPLTIEGDIASQMVDGIDRFLLRQIKDNAASRAERFKVDTSSPEAYEASLKPHREQLAKCLGIHDARMPFKSPEVIAEAGDESVIAQSDKFTVQAIRWPVLSDPSPMGQGLPSIFGEGLLLTPNSDVVANVIVLPDADQTPEQMCGLVEGIAEESQVARQLAESGCRVVVPAVISRHREKRLGRAIRRIVSICIGQHLSWDGRWLVMKCRCR